jgi:transcriptional regulator with XRE-family HTH domain
MEHEAQSGVGDRIRKARQAMGMSQEHLARAIGVSRSAVAQWETGRTGQVRANLARIAGTLGVSMEYVLTGGGSPSQGPAAESGDELALLRLYRACTEEDRAFLLRTAARMARQAERESSPPA